MTSAWGSTKLFKDEPPPKPAFPPKPKAKRAPIVRKKRDWIEALVMLVITKKGPQTMTELRIAVGIDGSATRCMVAKLVKRGKLKREGERGRYRSDSFYTYSLP